MRGRKPTATIIKIARGNPGKRAINKDEPKPARLDVACPAELTEPSEQEEWTRSIVPAIQRGQITSADRCFAIAHCSLWATWRSQLLDASRHAHVVAAPKSGHPMPNPARGMANRTFLLLAKVDAELGFTPTSRSRVKTDGGVEMDDLESAIG